MSSEPAIRVRGVGKRYDIYAEPHHRILQMFLGGKKRLYREFWALRDVSFDVRAGECVGIVGRNGSGKSTLLRIIAGTLTPTAGSTEVNGRASALLELGSGFHPHFTGRENVFLNGSLLGFSRKEVERRFDDIASFADIGQFMEQPVRTYSSGMMVRLAFAVAVSADPKIFVVDEAISVGDELFQRKCFSRLEAIKSRGGTILFVSHSAGRVIEMCDRAVLIDGGESILTGEPKKVVGEYQKLLYSSADRIAGVRRSIRESADKTVDSQLTKKAREAGEYFDPGLKPQSTLSYEPRGARIEGPEILDSAGGRVNFLKQGETYRYVYKVRFESDARDVCFGMMLKATNGTELGGMTSARVGAGLERVAAGDSAVVRFDFKCLLSKGVYFINAGCTASSDGESIYLHRILDAVAFRVLEDEKKVPSTGYVDFGAENSCCRVDLARS